MELGKAMACSPGCRLGGAACKEVLTTSDPDCAGNRSWEEPAAIWTSLPKTMAFFPEASSMPHHCCWQQDQLSAGQVTCAFPDSKPARRFPARCSSPSLNNTRVNGARIRSLIRKPSLDPYPSSTWCQRNLWRPCARQGEQHAALTGWPHQKAQAAAGDTDVTEVRPRSRPLAISRKSSAGGLQLDLPSSLH